ncbi:MAG TPA: rRNA pseudouridine synthase, partial [Acholeplasma sp.]|nr:rRNA pseudouridine synthase [Acholeplasma sp.]
MRIDRFLSNLKYGSRSEMTKAVKKGLVKVNDKIITDSHLKIDPNKDIIHFNDELVSYYDIINIMIYKPIGYLSANKDNLHKVVLDLIEDNYKRLDLKIAGRLDLDSEGLLILTTSGKFAHFITSPNNKINKVYEVILDNDITNYEMLLEGVLIKDGKNEEYLAKALDIKKVEDKKYLITLDEGKFHQVKRMFLALNTKVINLKRISIGNLKLG